MRRSPSVCSVTSVGRHVHASTCARAADPECLIGGAATHRRTEVGEHVRSSCPGSAGDPSCLHQGGGSRGCRLRHVRLPAERHPAGPGPDPGWNPGPDVGAEVPDTAADPAGDAAGRCPDQPRRQAGGLLRDLDAAVRTADPAGRSACHHGLGVRRGGVGEQTRSAGPQRALAHHRGHVEPAGPGQVDQRARGRQRELPAASAAGGPDAALGEPTRRRGRSRRATHVHRDPRALHRPGADGHPCPRFGRGR